MWPAEVNWEVLKFGVEIEFVNGEPESVESLPGWFMDLEERQLNADGDESGSELKSPPLIWKEREQIRVMLARLREHGAEANWSCGLHIHIGLEPWGSDIVLPLIDAALSSQHALQNLLNMSDHRRIFCPPVTRQMRQHFIDAPREESLRNPGRPQSHRCGINIAAWYDIGTVEIRYANGSLDYEEVINTIELCLRFTAAVGAGSSLPSCSHSLAEALGVSASGYPPATTAPSWYIERRWLEDLLIPLLSPAADQLVSGGEIHHILPDSEGLIVAVEKPDGRLSKFLFRPSSDGWNLLRAIE